MISEGRIDDLEHVRGFPSSRITSPLLVISRMAGREGESFFRWPKAFSSDFQSSRVSGLGLISRSCDPIGKYPHVDQWIRLTSRSKASTCDQSHHSWRVHHLEIPKITLLQRYIDQKLRVVKLDHSA